MKLVLKYLKNFKKETIIAPLFKMLEAIFELFVPLVIAALVDKGIQGGDDSLLYKCALCLIALAVIGLSCSLIAQYFSAKAAVGVSAALRHDLFKHLLGFSFKTIDEVGTDTMITRITADVNQVQNGVNMVLRLFLRSPFIVFGAMIMAFTINVREALIFVVTIPLLAIVVFGVMLLTMPRFKKIQQAVDGVLRITRENLSGVRVIRAFNSQDSEIEAFREQDNLLFRLQVAAGRLSAVTNPVTFVIVNVATLMLLYSGAGRVYEGVLTKGELVALINYMSQILVELVKLANLIVLVTKSLASAQRLVEVFELPEETDRDIIDGVLEKSFNQTSEQIFDNRSSETDEKCTPKRQQDYIVFEKVSLSYGDTEEALTDISFRAGRGETIGIIGGTGSGKSSLVNLIPALYKHTSGNIYINGKNIEAYSKDELRKQIAIVLQKAVLFSGTIRENLKWGREEASEADMIEALKKAQAWDFVSKQKDGLDSLVAQGGNNFSGGQKQRLTIARALVRKPEILILDDSSSALDYATDAALRAEIRQMQSTVFIVSQRPAALMHADKIIVLEDGRVAGIGTHEQLLEGCQEYREIYEYSVN